MDIRRFVVSQIQANCYVVSESLDKGAHAVIIDPGDTRLDEVFAYIDEHQFHIVANWNTHAHFDHVLGVDHVRNTYHCPSYLHPDDEVVWDEVPARAQEWTGEQAAPLRKPDEYYSDGDEVRLGDEVFTVWHTPGHSPGGVCLVGREWVFTGDTLFRSTIGRTDLPHADKAAMDNSLTRLLTLPQHLVVYPGHGDFTTMEQEQAHNRYLRIARRGGE